MALKAGSENGPFVAGFLLSLSGSPSGVCPCSTLNRAVTGAGGVCRANVVPSALSVKLLAAIPFSRRFESGDRKLPQETAMPCLLRAGAQDLHSELLQSLSFPPLCSRQYPWCESSCNYVRHWPHLGCNDHSSAFSQSVQQPGNCLPSHKY